MAFDSLVKDAKKRGLVRVQEAAAMSAKKYVSPHRGKILGDDDSPSASHKKVAVHEKKASGEESSLNEESVVLSWDKCRHRVKTGQKSLCRKFFTGCKEAGCPRKNIDV